MSQNTPPTADEQAAKAARLEVRLTHQEYQLVKTNAELSGLKISEYTRRCVLGQPLRSPLTIEQRRAVVGLSDNLNQAMKRAHQAGHYTDDLAQMLQRLREFLEV